MKRARATLVIVGVAIAAAAAGYWVGLHQGDERAALAMIARALSSAAYLEAGWDGKINEQVMLMESDIDAALVADHYLEQSFSFRLLTPLRGVDAETIRRECLTRLANYRKGHLSPYRPEALEGLLLAQIPESERKNLPEITPSLRQSMLETQQIVDGMVSRYAGKPSDGK